MAAEEVPGQRVKNILSSFLVSPNTDKAFDGNTEEVEDSDSSKGDPVFQDHKNQDTFYKRVETFTTLKWFAKPPDLSPLVCARYGWENTDTDILKCVSCKCVLFGQLPNLQKSDLHKHSCKKLKKSLVEAHKCLCPWRNNHSPGSYLTASIGNWAETSKGILEAYEDFIASSMNLPILSYKTLEEIGMNEDRLHSRVLQIYPDLSQDSPLNLPAFCLALFGWKRSTSRPKIILCKHCRRKVFLWNFKCAITSQNGNSADSLKPGSPQPGSETNGATHSPTSAEDNDSPSVKKIKLSVKEGLDPISEHQIWCPWVMVQCHGDFHQRCSENYSALSSMQTTPTSSKGRVSSDKVDDNTHSASVSASVSTSSDFSFDQSISPTNGQLCSFSPDKASSGSDKGAGYRPPWFTPLPSGTGELELPSWQKLLIMLSLWKPENLSTSYSPGGLKSSPPVEGLRHIRKILRDW